MNASTPLQTSTKASLRRAARAPRFGGRRIHERPPIVDQRGRVGDWEGATIVGKGLTRLVTVVDRKSGLGRIRKVPNGEADTVMRAFLSVMYPLHARVHTLTWDNGSEFAEHALIDIALKAKSYFAMPYSSWQRGCNENFSGFVRQYVPKGCDIDAFSDEKIQRIEDKLNQRPRKRPGVQNAATRVRPILQTRCTSGLNPPTAVWIRPRWKHSVVAESYPAWSVSSGGRDIFRQPLHLAAAAGGMSVLLYDVN